MVSDKVFKNWVDSIRLLNSFIGKAHTFLEPKKCGGFSIIHREATDLDCAFENERIMLSFNNRTRFTLRPGLYTYLMQGDEAIMSDTPTELFTNSDFISHANGDILIGGLGLGLMLKVLEQKKNIGSVTIIEKEQSVIDLVWLQLNLPSKFNVITHDIFTYTPQYCFDTIYTDIWTDLGTEQEAEMEILEEKFKPFLKLGGWIGSWRQQ